VRAKTIAAFLAATVIVGAFAVPEGASAAKPRPIRQPASVTATVLGHGTGGFEFSFISAGSHGDFLWLRKSVGGGGEESAVYFDLPRGGATNFANGRLDARIGRLGRFRGHFVPDASLTQGPEEGCTGDPTTIEKGHFVGSFSFRGEMGFTTVQARRAQGTVTREGASSCPASGPGGSRRHRSPHRKAERERKQREQETFRLLAGDAEGNLVFRAEREESPEPEEGSPTTFSASMTETIGRLQVIRSASVFEIGEHTATAFQVPNLAEPLAEATVSPSAPFSGSATFHLDSSDSADWTGDLAVELPGAGKVPLSGEDISAGVCQGPSHCTETLPRLLQKALEFGGTYYGQVGAVQKIS
jgi:hypothetical protein